MKSDALQPYRPDADGPWTRKQAGHLLRRAGFCGSAPEIDRVLEEGPETAARRLIEHNAGAESARWRDLDPLGEQIAARGDVTRLSAWWLARMLHTSRPLHARMALFWHNHFATSNQKVNAPVLMLQQLRTIERHALGRFDELLLAMSRDPAMIVWLDGESNRKGKPNENYARELFELFSLGPDHYDEADIREAARAFSGWHQREGRFFFNERLHDEGSKTIFGQSGSFDGTDVVRMCVEHAACAAFLAGKLLREFLCPEPRGEITAAFAAVLREENFDIGRALMRLLTSRVFFDAAYYRARIKSPVEFCAGLARSFEMRVPGEPLRDAVSQMGQRLFEPPSVKGWDGHRRWINSATMLVRMNAATQAASGNDGKGLDAARWTAEKKLPDAASAVEFACNLMLDGELDADVRLALRQTCTGSPEAALAAAVAAIAAGPDYQLS